MILLFADDTVLLAYTSDGLQSLLNQLNNYCVKWGITVNTHKTVVMVFKKGHHPKNVSLYYNNEILKNVTRFSYLGVKLSSNGSFYQTQRTLFDQARKAMFSLYPLFDKVNFDIRDKIKLFDSMVNPIFSYGSEVYGFQCGLRSLNNIFRY